MPRAWHCTAAQACGALCLMNRRQDVLRTPNEPWTIRDACLLSACGMRQSVWSAPEEKRNSIPVMLITMDLRLVAMSVAPGCKTNFVDFGEWSETNNEVTVMLKVAFRRTNGLTKPTPYLCSSVLSPGLYLSMQQNQQPALDIPNPLIELQPQNGHPENKTWAISSTSGRMRVLAHLSIPTKTAILPPPPSLSNPSHTATAQTAGYDF
ncbi:hypothetical protein RRG08_036603 [Elysia crispata]|uniref:Uncharacterized protein n=1 Tax=Elysia crispata TaxID=231223 RepID=A0AAE0ZRC9_9GAST|nr:hypothetical protein RRG08_036603 [Elysia crispata]